MDGAARGSESGHDSRISEEFQDGAGLELSLGLGFSSSGPKKRSSDAQTLSSSSADLASDDPVPSSTAMNSIKISSSKVPGKGSGLDAALKKFLEGRLDEQDDSGRILDGSPSGFAQQRSKEKLPDPAGGDGKGNPFLFREIPLSSSGSRGHSPAHHLFVDAFKMGPASDSAEAAAAQWDADDAAAHVDGLDEQRKILDVRGKRKLVNEEQPEQKKCKADDDPVKTLGFHRAGSGVWARGLEVDKPLLSLSGNDAGEKEMESTRNKQQEGPASDKGYESDEHESPGTMGDASKGVEVNFMCQLRPPNVAAVVARETNRSDEGVWHVGGAPQSQTKDKIVAGASALPNSQQHDGKLANLSIGREGETVGSASFRKEKDKVPSETSSTGTDVSDKKEDKSHGAVAAGETSSVIVSNDKPFPTSTAPPFPSSAFANMNAPYSVQPFASSGASSGSSVLSFPVNFPYTMQHVPPGSDSQVQNNPPTKSPSVLHDRIPSLEGTSWMQALRPPVLSNVRNQGMKINENGNSGRNVSMGVDTSPLGNHPLQRTLAQNGSQEPTVAISQLHRPPGLPVMSSPAVPQFPSQHMQGESGELHLHKDQTGINAFHGFAASIPVAQGLSSSLKPSSSAGNDDSGAKVDNQQMHHRNNAEPNNLTQEELRRSLGGQFQQGTTDNLSLVDGIGDEIANLQKGIAPGMKFGGTGSTPDLPWVHTTGPNGRTISGVLYRLGPNQLKIVCACHGKHMSPTEFSQHASGTDMIN